MIKSEHLDPHFREEVLAESGGEDLMRCFACGTCMAACLIRRFDPEYNPRRVLRMATMGLRQPVLSSRVIWECSACEACYKHCPQNIHISELFAALRRMALREGYSPPASLARVNERTCVACGACVEACPYDAPELVEKRVLGREKTVSQINPALCMGCGVCAATCRSASIDLVELGDENVLRDESALSDESVIETMRLLLRSVESEEAGMTVEANA